MQHLGLKVFAVFVLGAVLAGGISLAVAAPPGPGGAGLAQNLAPAPGSLAQGFHRGWRGGMRGPAFAAIAGMRGPGFAAIADLRSMRRLYLLQGQRKQVTDLYRYVLSKTRDPVLRNYAYRQLARSQLQISNADAALATLRQNLEENLAQLNKAGGGPM